MLLLKPEDIRGLVTVAEAISAVELGFKEWAKNRELNRPRQRVHVPSGVRVSVHQGGSPAAGRTGLVAHSLLLKQMEDVQKSLRHAESVHVLFDAETSDLDAIVIGNLLPAERPDDQVMAGLRTASASAVGTNILARQDSKVLGLIGAGRHARFHLLAFAAIRKLDKIKVYRRDTSKLSEFVRDMEHQLAIEVVPVNSAREAIEDSDIVLTATNSAVPVFDGDWLEPGQHVTSIVGSNVGLVKSNHRRTKRRELDDRTIERMDVIAVASFDQIIQDEQADLFDPLQKGIIKKTDITDIGDILIGRAEGRTSSTQITCYKNNAGQGICDVTLAAKFVERAREQKRGTELPLGGYFRG